MNPEKFIKELYLDHPKPLYLSALGTILKKEGHQIDNLKEFVEKMDGFNVACGPEKERTAIASDKDIEEVEKILNKRSQEIDKETLKFLSKLPRTLLYAFASKSKTGSNAYFINSPPYRFGFTKKDDDMIEIKRDLLIDARIPLNLNQLDNEIAKKLHDNIERWINDNKLDISVYTKNKQRYLMSEQTTLLEELFNAIPANKRSKVVLPLDIIGYLISKR